VERIASIHPEGKAMKRNRLVFGALMLLVFSAVSSAAQPRPQGTAARPTPTPAPRPAVTSATNAPVPESHIALIDTGMFGDEKNGIFLYIDATKKVQAEFEPRTTDLQNMQTRLAALANEIQTLSKAPAVDQKTIQAKQAEGVRLQQEMTTKKDRLDEDVAKRYQQVISPVSNQIGAAMDQFARQRGITMTLDINKLLPAILTAVPAIDLTQAFIDEFNRTHPRTAAPTR
jgi:Skp family chaperone for outer membrane proteins